MLELVEITAFGIAACRLPALDRSTRVVIELAGCLGLEAESVQSPLHLAPLGSVQTDLVFRRLVGVFGEGGGIDARRQMSLGLGCRERDEDQGKDGDKVAHLGSPADRIF